jgi:hypothetical protein
VKRPIKASSTPFLRGCRVYEWAHSGNRLLQRAMRLTRSVRLAMHVAYVDESGKGEPLFVVGE